ncbi:MAG TPA: hypothetical protein VGR02_01110 [Thermoanaerobaculia bacterium]|jgi:hypothetical protein|nr:hypothetical protein [Thermoanaerobaculia bacterium]
MLKRFLALLGSLACTGSLLAAPSATAADPGTFHGRTIIKSYDEHRILIALDSRGANKADHLFRFWSDQPLPLIDLKFDAASLQFYGTELILVTDDDAIVYRFTVGGSQPHQFRLSENAVATGYTGYGLNHQMPSPAPRAAAKGGGVDPDPSLSCDFGDCEQPSWEWYGNGNCTSGGVGSTSCSLSVAGASCSTSCEAGYYACCTSTFGGISCTCVHK